MALSPREIAGLFSYCRLKDRLFISVGELGGMWFEARISDRRDGRDLYTIRKLADYLDGGGSKSTWNLSFTVHSARITGETATESQKGRVYRYRRVTRKGVITITEITGDQEAYLKDAALIRLFYSVIEEELAELGCVA